MSSERFGEKYFGTNISNLNFVFLSIITVGLASIFWTHRMVRGINEYFNETKIHPALPWVISAIWAWMWVFSTAVLLFIVGNIEHITVAEFSSAKAFWKYGLKFFLILFVAIEMLISYKAKACISTMLAEQGIPSKIRWRDYSFFYYIIHNAEERHAQESSALSSNAASRDNMQTKEQSRISQLENLAKLRDSGALTEEEFQSEKSKLLSK